MNVKLLFSRLLTKFGHFSAFYDDVIMTQFCRVSGMDDDVAADVFDDMVDDMVARW